MMIYTKQTIVAMNIAYNAHHGTIGKDGVPYIFHPFHLAEQMNDEESTTVALLHDVVEDTDMTFEDLQQHGFSERVIEALRLLTHEKGSDYMDYIHEIAKDPLATKVKLADLVHNSDVSRYCGREMTEREKTKKEIYRKAIEYLMEQGKR